MDKKISQLTTLAQGDIAPTSDVVAIVDTNVPETKKTTADALVKSVLAQATALPITNADINGGTIDGTVIGGTTPAAGSFTTVTENGKPVVSQNDVGTAPNQVPLNQYLGNVAFMDSNQLVVNPAASVSPAGIGDMVFQLTSNTSLEIKVRGSDGTVRSVALTLA
jgi:hypothetical protein